MAKYNSSRQKQKQLLQFKIHRRKSKTLAAKAKHSRQKRSRQNREWRSAVVQVRGVPGNLRRVDCETVHHVLGQPLTINR